MQAWNLLLVEDDPMTCEFMVAVLTQAGHAVTKARTLAEAVAVVRAKPVELAIIDVELPGSTGDGVAVARELLHHRPMPLIFVTGHTDADTLQRVKTTQPAAFLSKPFQPIDLTMQVELVMQATQAQRAAENLLPDCLLLLDNGQWIKVRKAEIVYAQADGNYTNLFVFNRLKPHVVTNNLKNVIPQLTLSRFYPLSRSYIVNLDYLIGLKETQLLLRISENPKAAPQPIPIPAEGRAALLRRLPLVRSR